MTLITIILLIQEEENNKTFGYSIIDFIILLYYSINHVLPWSIVKWNILGKL